MKKLLLILSVIPFLFACNSSETTSETTTSEPIAQDESHIQIDDHNSRNALDWQGMYNGILPCADCEGIRMTLALQDGRYKMARTYLGKDGSSTHLEGDFTWSEDGSTITLLGEENAPAQYKVGENRLIQLDMEGNPITGSLADKYVLTKVNSPILDITWELSELDGKPVEVEGIKPFNLLFDTAFGVAGGFAGCNGFSGEFQIKEQELEIFGVFRTEMACEPAVMKIESGYLKALEEVDNFVLEDDTLILKTGNTVLAKLLKEK